MAVPDDNERQSGTDRHDLEDRLQSAAIRDAIASAMVQAQRQNNNGRLKSAAPWLAAIVVSVLSYFGAQGAITNLGSRVDTVEGDVATIEVDIRTLQSELDMARTEVTDIAGIADRIEQSVEEATARGIRIGLAAVLKKEYGISPP